VLPHRIPVVYTGVQACRTPGPILLWKWTNCHRGIPFKSQWAICLHLTCRPQDICYIGKFISNLNCALLLDSQGSVQLQVHPFKAGGGLTRIARVCVGPLWEYSRDYIFAFWLQETLSSRKEASLVVSESGMKFGFCLKEKKKRIGSHCGPLQIQSDILPIYTITHNFLWSFHANGASSK